MREQDQMEKYHANKTKKEKMKLETILCEMEKELEKLNCISINSHLFLYFCKDYITD